MGSSLTSGSMKPETTMVVASSAVRPAAHQVKELLFTNFGNRGFMTDGYILFIDLNVRVRIRARLRIEKKRIADHVGFDVIRAFVRPSAGRGMKIVRRPC